MKGRHLQHAFEAELGDGLLGDAEEVVVRQKVAENMRVDDQASSR